MVLGVVWLIDAALQYQPYMFSRSFVTEIIEPTTAGNPSVVAQSVTWAAHLMVHHIAIYNAIYATIQLLIAAGLFFNRTAKAALAASIVWALAVWWFAESLGGTLIGSSPLAGVPGAVVLYALIAVLLWPSDRPPSTNMISPATSGPLGVTVPTVVWAALWASFACYLLLPANRSPSAISGVFSGMTEGQPAWIASVETSLSTATAHRGTEISLVLAVTCALVGLAVVVRRGTRPALVLAVVLGVVFWIAEGFGAIFTGRGTDPNSGLLLTLLAACYWPTARPLHAAPGRTDQTEHIPAATAR